MHETTTPILVIDLDTVTEQYRAFTEALPGVAVHYAMKCNPHPEILQRLHGLGGRFEIASAEELDALLAIGVDPAHLLYTNPVKPPAHIAHTYAAGVRTFAFDSTAELAKLASLAPGSAVVVRLAAHDLDSEVPSEGKFGVDPETAVALLLAARDLGLVPHGVAFHVGSQMMSPRAWRYPLRQTADMMRALRPSGVRLGLVDLGGGFPARYDVPPPPLRAYAEVIHEGLGGLPYQVEVAIEPGRALVAEAGTLTATVIGVAHRLGRRWVHTDVGAFNGLMESLETRNQLRYPLRDSRAGGELAPCHLTGPTCDSQDTVLFDARLSADLAVGDLVHIGSTGAYTTVYASQFNGFGAPSVRCVTRGNHHEDFGP